MNKFELKFSAYKLPRFDTPAFVMNPVELKDYIDFEVKRIYYIVDPKKETGSHCHKVEEELFILAKGSAVAVIDRGNGLEEFKLQSPSDALYVGSYVWHHFKDLSPDAVLIALSSTNYNPDRSDYIEDYEAYQKEIQKLKMKDLS